MERTGLKVCLCCDGAGTLVSGDPARGEDDRILDVVMMSTRCRVKPASTRT